MNRDDRTNIPSREQRFLEHYISLTSPDRLREALSCSDNPYRAFVERRIGASLSDDQPLDAVLARVGRLVRENPAVIDELLSDCRPPRQARYLGDMIRLLPADRSLNEEEKSSLRVALSRIDQQVREIWGIRIGVDIDALASCGGRVLHHLLNSSTAVPRLDALLDQMPRKPLRVPAVPKRIPAVKAAAETAQQAPEEQAQPTTGPVQAAGTATPGGTVSQPPDPCVRWNLRQPTSGNSNTFPGLNEQRTEDIYYDFSIVVPVGEPTPQEIEEEIYDTSQFESFRGTAFQALAALVSTVVATLQDAGLLAIFGTLPSGQPAVSKLAEVIANYAANSVSDSQALENRRRVLREMAGAMRLIARLRLHVAPTQVDGLDKIASLWARIDLVTGYDANGQNKFKFTTQSRKVPKHCGPRGPQGNFLEHGIPKNSMVEGPPSPDPERTENLLWHTDIAAPPDAVWGALGAQQTQGVPQRYFNWLYHSGNLDPIADYLGMLGGKYDDIANYANLAREAGQLLLNLQNQIQSGKAGSAEYLRKIEQLLGGLANDAAYTLATLTDELAELIEIPHARPVPGRKRLALQVIYRQYWNHSAYVKGKLVGYKSLLPGESQQVKRRTFIKTTHETTTTTDFASTRQSDLSQTQRETSEVLREATERFGFKASASGHFDFFFGGAEIRTDVNGDLSSTSRGVRNSISESVAKSTVSFNNKREVKVRDLVESEVSEESIHDLKNANQEITANYFYYQLLREYEVTTEMYDVRPVLLVARDYPTPAQIDEVWLSKHLHDILWALPPQLGADAESVVNNFEQLGRRMIRLRSHAARAQALYDAKRDTLLDGIKHPGPLDDKERESLTQAAAAASEAREAFQAAESQFCTASSRLSRVVAHVRENIVFYMQRIWQSASNVDREHALRQEVFRGSLLDKVTRGLNRVGFIGPEEIYEYTGPSVDLLQLMLELITRGSDIMSRSDGDVLKERLIERAEREWNVDRQTAISRLTDLLFVGEPGGLLGVPTVVQVAQDALVVEALPGQVSLLEGFKLAHRALDVERACLENEHLRARIQDRPWNADHGRDDYRVVRHDGNAGESNG